MSLSASPASLWERRDLLFYLTARNLKVRYKNSTLGFLWSLLNPLLMMLIYFVFASLLRFPVDLPFLLTGVICWHFTALCLNDSLDTVGGHINLIKKIAFPRLILPLALILANAANTLLSFGVLLAFLMFFKVGLTQNLLFLPAAFAVHACFCLGCALILSTLSVYFDDTRHLLGALMSAWFFLSPVIYPPTMVPERFVPYFLLNPMAGILAAYRLCFLNQPWPEWQSAAFMVSAGAAVALLVCGVWFFERYQKFFADEL